MNYSLMLADSLTHTGTVFLPFNRSAFALLPRSPTIKQSVPVRPNVAKGSREEKSSPNLATSKLYCAACRKKFSSEATWKTHLKSAKHLQNNHAANKMPAAVSLKTS